jgi:hypothetical protein
MVDLHNAHKCKSSNMKSYVETLHWVWIEPEPNQIFNLKVKLINSYNSKHWTMV